MSKDMETPLLNQSIRSKENSIVQPSINNRINSVVSNRSLRSFKAEKLSRHRISTITDKDKYEGVTGDFEFFENIEPSGDFYDLPQIEILKEKGYAYTFNYNESSMYIVTDKSVDKYEFPLQRDLDSTLINSRAYENVAEPKYISISQDEQYMVFGNTASIVIANVEDFFQMSTIMFRIDPAGIDKVQSTIHFTGNNDIFYCNEKCQLVKVEFKYAEKKEQLKVIRYNFEEEDVTITRIQPLSKMILIAFASLTSDVETIRLFDPQTMKFVKDFQVEGECYYIGEDLIITYLNENIEIYELSQNYKANKKATIPYNLGQPSNIEFIRFEGGELYCLNFEQQIIVVLNIETLNQRSIFLKSRRVPKIFKQHNLFKTNFNMSPPEFLFTKNADKLIKINLNQRSNNFRPVLFGYDSKGKIQSISNEYCFFQKTQKHVTCYNINSKKSYMIELDRFYQLYPNGGYYFKKHKIFMLIYKTTDGQYSIALFNDEKKSDIKYINDLELKQSYYFNVCKNNENQIQIYSVNQHGKVLRVIISKDNKQADMITHEIKEVYDLETQLTEIIFSEQENMLFFKTKTIQHYQYIEVNQIYIAPMVTLISDKILQMDEVGNTIIIEQAGEEKIILKQDFSTNDILSKFTIEKGGHVVLFMHNWIMFYSLQQREIFLGTNDRQIQVRFHIPIDFLIEKGQYFSLFQDNQEIDNIFFENQSLQKLFKFYLHRQSDQFYNGITQYVDFLPGKQTIFYDDRECRYDFLDLEGNKLCSLYTSFDAELIYYMSNVKHRDPNLIIQDMEKRDFKDFITHLTPRLGSFLHQVADKDTVLEEFLKRLKKIENQQMPLLFVKNDHGKTAFDIVMERFSIKSLHIFLEILVKLQNNTLNNYVIDKHLCKLIEKGIDLRNYFESDLSIFQIKNTAFPSNHWDNSIILKQLDFETAADVGDNYDIIFENDFKSETQSTKIMQIDYFLINMPETMTRDPKRIIKAITKSQRLDIFENKTIQTIIKFKWEMYTRSFYIRQFFIFLAFFIALVVDLYVRVLDYSDTFGDEVLQYEKTIFTLFLKLVCILCQFYFLYYESRSAMRSGVKYFQDFWNYTDILIIVCFLPPAILDFFEVDNHWGNIITCVLLILCYIKLNFYLRIFSNLRFLVSMIQGVFIDLKYFLTFFFLVVIEISLLFAVMLDVNSTADFKQEYTGLGKIGFFLAVFRLSTGDFMLTDVFDGQPGIMIYVTWGAFVFAVLILNIVFMNFIIAVISESYEKIMQNLNSESFKIKAEMILERELHLNDDELRDPKLFPRFLLLRQPVGVSDDHGEAEIQGLVKTIQKSIEDNSLKQKVEFDKRFDELKKLILEQNDRNLLDRTIT